MSFNWKHALMWTAGVLLVVAVAVRIPVVRGLIFGESPKA